MENISKANLYLNRGAKFFIQGKTALAITTFRKALEINPHLTNAYFNLALAYQKENDLPQATACFQALIKQDPRDIEALNLLGRLYDLQNQSSKSFKYYRQALKIKADYAPALTNMGAAYAKLKKFKSALDCYQKSIEVNSDYPIAYVFLGNTLISQGNLDDAILCYRLAIEKDPQNDEAYNNLGTAYARKQRYGDAVIAFKKSLSLNKNSKQALENLAVVYTAAKKNIAGIKYLQKAFSKFPHDGVLASNLYHEMCDVALWSDAAKLKIKLDQITDQQIAAQVKTGEDPFINVVHNVNPKRNLEIARLWSQSLVENLIKDQEFIFNNFAKSKHKKIRIGYFSAHFHNHPTSHLITKLIQKHDRKKFEIYVYSAGPDDKSMYFEKIRKAADIFVNLFTTNLSNCAIEIKHDQIDILVDLDGFTDNNRLQVFALKPAPIQISYLGFPGTTGSTFIDYLIADQTVIPPENRKYFSEKIIYLPHSYQVNDNTQPISSKKFSRKDLNLPEKSIVFACFNATYKIEPELFKIWMKILQKVPQSVLWLLENGNLAKTNFQKAARDLGIDPKRLIFAKRMDKSRHLSRLALANLVLDTFTCNGHTSTSDALWAGVPVLTLLGRHFASRVSASLLKAVNLPQLITYSPTEYENLAIDLAKNPQKLSEISSQLISSRLNSPLFNTELFTKNLENAYLKVWQLYQSGQKTKDLKIKD